MEFFLAWRQRHRQRQRRRLRRQRLVIQSIVVAKLSERWLVAVEGGRELAGWEVIAKWSELASSGGWTAGRLATFISIDTCSSSSSGSSRDSDSSRICLHLAISTLPLSLLLPFTLPLTSWGDNAAFLTHKNVENQAEIMRTNWATKVVLRRKAEEEEQKAALVVGAGGGGVGARPHEYENARRENSCHCLTQPTPTPCPAPSKRSLCLQLPRKGERRGELQATPWLASALALHYLPPCRLPSPSAAHYFIIRQLLLS